MTDSPLDVSDKPVSVRLRKSRRVLLVSAILFAAGVFAFLLIHESVLSAAEGRIYTVKDVPVRRVAVVFGAKVFEDWDVSWPLEIRLSAALALYEAGKVRKILVSGDNRWHHYNEPECMKEWLVAHGVPAGDVGCDYAGRRTLDTCARAASVWNLGEAILVTQRYHLPRALFLAEAWGLDALGVAADENRNTACRRDRVREALARVGAWVDVYLLDRQPHFFGKPEEI